MVNFVTEDEEMLEIYRNMSNAKKDVFMSVRLICKETHKNGGNMKAAIKTHSEKTGIPVEVLKKRVAEQLGLSE